MIYTKKNSMVKPITYNFLSPKQIQEEEESINHNYENKKIVYSLSQKNLKINDDYKNKEEKSIEFIQDTNKYLQQEYNNKNNKNKFIKNYLLNNKMLCLDTLQNKCKINENNNLSIKKKIKYKAPYNNKKNGKQFGEESITSINSTSSGFILHQISSYGDTSSYINKSSESDIFQKEMRRIMNFNRRLNSNGKDISVQFNNSIIKKKIKKSISEPNFLDKKNLCIFQNGEKSMYYKNNESKKNLYKPNNATSFTTKNFFLKNNQINCFNNNINNKKYNIKSSLNKNPIKSKAIFNNENSKINFADYSQDKQNYFVKQNENNYDNIYNYKNESNDNENPKFRFVLDKYIKKQKKRSPKLQINIQKNKNNKKENKRRKNSDDIKKIENKAKIGKVGQDNLQKNESKHSNILKDKKILDNKNYNKISYINPIIIDKEENSGIISSIREKKTKENNNNEKSNENDDDSFFKEGINIDDLCDNNINEIKMIIMTILLILILLTMVILEMMKKSKM